MVTWSAGLLQSNSLGFFAVIVWLFAIKIAEPTSLLNTQQYGYVGQKNLPHPFQDTAAL
jgi:hypothetical protein